MRTVIYNEAIKAIEQNNGSIPNWFDVSEPSRKLRYKNGWQNETEEIDEHLFDTTFDLLEEGEMPAAYHEADKIFSDETDMDNYIQVINDCIQKHSSLLESSQMNAFVKSVLKYTIYPQAVRFALLIADNMPVIDDELFGIIKVYAQISMFSERALHIIQHQKNGNDVIYSIAKTSYGMTKANAVHALQPADQEIKDWLLHCCGENGTIFATGIDVYKKCNFEKMLSNPHISEDDLAAIGYIILKLDDDCPVLVYSAWKLNKSILDQEPVKDLSMSEWKSLFSKYYEKTKNIFNQKTVNNYLDFYLEIKGGNESPYDHYKDQRDITIRYLENPNAEPFILNWICEYGENYLLLNETVKDKIFFVDPSEYAIKAIRNNPSKIYYADVIFSSDRQLSVIKEALDKLNFSRIYDIKTIYWFEKNIIQDTDAGQIIKNNPQIVNAVLQTDFNYYLKNKEYYNFLLYRCYEVPCIGAFAVMEKLKAENYSLKYETKQLSKEVYSTISADRLEKEIEYLKDRSRQSDEEKEELNGRGEYMKKFLIISDSHNHPNLVGRLKEDYKDKVDYMIHCGDSANKANLDGFITVQGNCDPYESFPMEEELACEGHHILILHGHSVFPNWASFNAKTMASYGQKKGCDIVIFGHSHQYYDETVNGVRLLNPGALIGGHPGDYQLPSYMIMEINGKEITIEKHMNLPFVIG